MTFASRGSNFSLSSNYNDYLDDISSQFEKLSKRVSSKKDDVLEDVYESMVKDVKALTSKEPPHRHMLVKKATGILKLSHYQQNQQNPRAATAPSSTANLEDYDYDDYFFQLENRNDKLGKEFRNHLGKHQDEIISKLTTNGGNFSQIWDEFEAVSHSENSTRPPTRNKMSRSSIANNSAGSSTMTRPSWKYFSNQKVLSSPSPSTTSITSSASSKTSNLASTFSKRNVKAGSSTEKRQNPPKPKSEYMKQVFVVKGQVITFKANEFSQFSNWFGDDELLQHCRGCRGEFQRELDLSGFNNSEIKIKLNDGHKLVVEAYRPVRNGLPPLRHKSTILIPQGVSVDKLIICRTPNGRLHVLHLEKFPGVGNNKKKKKM